MADRKETSMGQTPEAVKAQSTESLAPQYMKEALLLANSYTQMLAERERLKKRLAGSWVYTKTMAIEELDSITVAYEGERVQSSNISNPTERIALKLTDEYMAKKQREMDAAKAACERDLEYVNWKIEVVETVFHDRLNEEQQDIFRQIYIQHKTFKTAAQTLWKKKKLKMSNRNICEYKKQIWEKLMMELEFCSSFDRNQLYLERLWQEAGEI